MQHSLYYSEIICVYKLTAMGDKKNNNLFLRQAEINNAEFIDKHIL
jgi:hypothetical protein